MTNLRLLNKVLALYFSVISVLPNASQASLLDNVTKYSLPNTSILADSISLDKDGELENFDSTLKLVTRIQLNKELYEILNKQFGDLLEIDPNDQKRFLLPPKSTGLSESQLLALLLDQRTLVEPLRQFLDFVPDKNSDSVRNTRVKRADMRKLLMSVKRNQPNLLLHLKALANPSSALKLHLLNGQPAISKTEFFINHPRILNFGSERTVVLPADDLKKVAIEFINGAQKSVTGNFFEFDLQDVARVMVEASNRNIQVKVGVDAGALEMNDKIIAVAKIFEGTRAVLKPVRTPGLNHMKILVRDPGLPTAAILISSGNLTQSCIGPEGDLVNVPENLRPNSSVPNANHTIIIHGELPSIVAKHQLDKILNMELYGQKSFPLGGAYKFYKANSSGSIGAEWMILSFSPNGGNGDINNDILKQILLSVDGPIGFLQFAFSSPTVIEAIQVAKQRAIDNHEQFELFGLGDKTFAMREFSAFLPMVGLTRDLVTKRYSQQPSQLTSIMSEEELAQTRASIHIAPPVYGEKYHFIQGQKVKTTGKIHHKVMMAPKWDITVAGTSFNFSKNAEQNNEQIAVFRDQYISEQMMAGYRWLVANSKYTVFEEAERRNAFNLTTDERSDSLEDLAAEPDDIDKSSKKPKRKGPTIDTNKTTR